MTSPARLADLTACWREDDERGADWIGPVEPPMVRWVRAREPYAWEVEMVARRAPAASVAIERPMQERQLELAF